jgi:hypothetical protein
MGKFVTDTSLRVKNSYILYFKNLNFNCALSYKIKFIKNLHILQNLVIIRRLANILDTPLWAIYINTTTSSLIYYRLKSYLISNFFKILCTSYNIHTKFKVFFLIHCMHPNISYANTFIKKALEIPLFNVNTYIFFFIKQNLISISRYDQLFTTLTLLKRNMLINSVKFFILNRLLHLSGFFFILSLLLIFYCKYFKFHH